MSAEVSALRSENRERPRPRIHFTAHDGWINDPYGIAWIDGQYHLYYQAVPGRVTWGPNCHWGHATSNDLVHWREQPLALTPQDFEVGCWSGSVVDTDPRTIFYTRVAGENWEIGQVAIATRDAADGSWRTGPDDVVIDAPPPELQLRCFRDPSVFRRKGDWALLMAAALPDGSGAVVQYTSPDLKRWTYDALLCSRPANSDGLNTGGVWECPQLFPIGDRWVLVVSVGHERDLLYVAAAVGDYDGRTFEPARWQRLTYGSSAYASTAFLDKEGRRCLLSWLREEPRDNPSLTGRASAHSVASTVALDAAGGVVLAPHPDVDALRSSPLTGHAADGGVRYGVDEAPVDVSTSVSGGLWCEIAEPEGWRARLGYDEDRHTILVHRPQLPTGELPLPPGDLRVRALLDADILEIFTAGTYGAFRIAPAVDPSRTTLFLGAAGTTTVVRPLTG